MGDGLSHGSVENLVQVNRAGRTSWGGLTTTHEIIIGVVCAVVVVIGLSVHWYIKRARRAAAAAKYTNDTHDLHQTAGYMSAASGCPIRLGHVPHSAYP